MSSHKKKFGKRSLKREKQALMTLIFFFAFAVFGIYFAIRSQNLNFDLSNDASGRTFFLSSGDDLQRVIDMSTDSDAIFLRVGTYTPTSNDGFIIKDKDIRILGAGSDFVNINGNGKTNVFHLQNASVSIQDVKITGANQSGVLVENRNAKDVLIKNATISSNSEAGIKTDSKTILQTSLVSKNAAGIKSSGGEVIVESSMIEQSNYSGLQILSSSNANSRIQNVVFYKNNEKGILLEGGSKHTIKNVTLSENGDGIVETGSSTTTITNTAVINSKKQGVVLKGASTIKYSDSFGNIQGNYSPTTLSSAEGNISLGTEFDENFRPATGSSLIDKGDTSEKDQDGSRIDIGAFGGNPNLIILNSKPTISSKPLEFIKAGERYSYEIKATDPDNDSLSYAILNDTVPSWIKLSGNILSGTPGATDVGFAGIMMVVSDGHGHNIVHPVSINVIPSNRSTGGGSTTPTPTSTVTTTSTPSTTTTPRTSTPSPSISPSPTEPGNTVPKITIVSPKEGAQFEKGKINIAWQLTNSDRVESVELKYSVDKENFTTITTLPATQTSYSWDAQNVDSGKYILKISAKEKGTSPLTVAELSNEFEVKDVPQNVSGGELVITKNSPPDNDITKDFKPIIYVEFRPDVDIDKTKTYLKANGENLDYKSTKNTIYFEPIDPFIGNKVLVEVKIVGTNGAEVSKKWTFSLPAQTNPRTDTGAKVDVNTKVLGLPRTIGLIVLGVLVLGLLLAILYFVVKLIKTIREERQGSLEAEFIEYYDTPRQESEKQPTSQPTAGPVPSQIAGSQLDQYLATPTEPAVNQIQTPVYPEVQATTESVVQASTTPDLNAVLTGQEQQPAQPQPVDPYVEELKKKYGINGDSTAEQGNKDQSSN